VPVVFGFVDLSPTIRGKKTNPRRLPYHLLCGYPPRFSRRKKRKIFKKQVPIIEIRQMCQWVFKKRLKSEIKKLKMF